MNCRRNEHLVLKIITATLLPLSPTLYQLSHLESAAYTGDSSCDILEFNICLNLLVLGFGPRLLLSAFYDQIIRYMFICIHMFKLWLKMLQIIAGECGGTPAVVQTLVPIQYDSCIDNACP